MKSASITVFLGLAVLSWLLSLYLSAKSVHLHGVPLSFVFLGLSAILVIWSIARFIANQRR
ncbi:MAG TPA: hypothetical protein VL128_00835 [Candidatus Eisenbacteria bacterium]|nr:hypothetical protein [Candidatus Eisenbacteria bacterium]